MKKSLLLFFLITLVSVVSRCSITVSDGGSGTGSGNPVIVGKVFNSDGSPAIDAKVMLRRSDFLKDTSLAGVRNDYVDSSDTETGSDGTFRFSAVDTGQYYIEVVAEGGSLQAVLLECEVTEYDTSIAIPDDTLRTMEKISGNASLFGGPNAKKYVQVYGLERVVEADGDGDFEIDVPRGEYTLRVVTGSDEYEDFEISDIESNDTPVAIKMLSSNPVSDSWECDTLIVRAFLDSNGIYNISATYYITIIDTNGRIYQLDVEHPSLHTVPSIIGGLHTLRDLEIQYSSVESIPERIGELVELRELELNDNHLTTLPIEITNLLKLTECRLGYNKLKNLPPAVEYWADRFDPDWADTQDTTAVFR
jgi:hypothetical protein